jgi:hypothetical protein
MTTIEALRAIPRDQRHGAIEAAAHRYSLEASIIEGAALVLMIAGWLAVWAVLPS